MGLFPVLQPSGEKFMPNEVEVSPIFSTTLTINVRVFFVQFLMGEKFIRRGGSPIFSTSALTINVRVFLCSIFNGNHLAKRFHDQRE
jgi:hypothetical protein